MNKNIYLEYISMAGNITKLQIEIMDNVIDKEHLE